MSKLEYNPQSIEPKWQAAWEKQQLYQAETGSKKPKWYTLVEFPYPSGDGLHTGHVRSYTAMDVLSRKRRMQGYNVLYPMGWDAFGLPTENYAIKTGVHPSVVTKNNTNNFRRQLQALGFSIDWSREINTTDPEYYKWTQWIFLKLFAHGLAYKKEMKINWCPSCKIGLANEEVVNGQCERCGAIAEKRTKAQWMLAITKYAKQLYADLDQTQYLEKIATSQRNWIGPSAGSHLTFTLTPSQTALKVFTTRPDTLFGVTYVVIAPDHGLVTDLLPHCTNQPQVQAYITATKAESEIERQAEDRPKTGVPLEGVMAINPANQQPVPVWIGDYVLAEYGTGAVMAVPAHDERDFQFAKQYQLPIIPVIQAKSGPTPDCFTGLGVLINSGQFDGLSSEAAKSAITKAVDGQTVTTYKLRDWIFSRQHYWGEPIPMINCPQCGWVSVPESDLPVTLPKVEQYQPTDNGESPLAAMQDWVNTTCPKCGIAATRETDTMPNWAGSSWYFLRYLDPHNPKQFASPEALKYWGQVDWYNGGQEHTTLHLLYSRFWNKVLYDLKLVPYSEPYLKRTSQGMVLGEGGVKMSKSKGNVVNPDGVVQQYGADTLRVYELFMGPFDQSIPWDTKNISGCSRFLAKVWALRQRVSEASATDQDRFQINTLIQKVDQDIEKMSYNTSIAAFMSYVNSYDKLELPQTHWQLFLTLLAPFAPHITEELWEQSGRSQSIHLESWPQPDLGALKQSQVEFVVQINGKVRAKLELPAGTSEAEVIKTALACPKLQPWLKDMSINKQIFVPDRLLSLVVD